MLRCVLSFFVLTGLPLFLHAQEKLSAHWEELTGPDFIKAITKSAGHLRPAFRNFGKTWRASASRH